MLTQLERIGNKNLSLTLETHELSQQVDALRQIHKSLEGPEYLESLDMMLSPPMIDHVKSALIAKVSDTLTHQYTLIEQNDRMINKIKHSTNCLSPTCHIKFGALMVFTGLIIYTVTLLHEARSKQRSHEVVTLMIINRYTVRQFVDNPVVRKQLIYQYNLFVYNKLEEIRRKEQARLREQARLETSGNTLPPNLPDVPDTNIPFDIDSILNPPQSNISPYEWTDARLSEMICPYILNPPIHPSRTIT